MPPRHHVVLAAVLATACSQASAVVITNADVAYTEDFDTLATSGTSSVLPGDWAFSESGPNANGTYGATTGSSNTGNTYSFGAAESGERALGTLRSGTLIPLIGVEVTNATGLLLDTLAVRFTGEQWRIGALGRTDRLDFQFSTDATSLISGTWADVDSLDFTAPTTAGAVGALDGNLAAHRVAIAASIAGLAWGDGASLWLRWSDLDAAGADDSLAIDDFSVTATRPPPPESHSVPDSLPMAAALGLTMLGLAAVGSRRAGMGVG